jgi:competence protein ComEC
MLPLATAIVALAWCLQFFDSRPLLAVPAPVWAGTALLAWCLLGGRAALVVLAAGWTLVRADWSIEQRLPESLAGRDVLVRGFVCDFPRSGPEATRFVLEPDAAFAREGLPARIHVVWYDDAPPMSPGERWQLLLRLRAPRGLANPAGFDFEQWLFVRDIGATAYVRRSPVNGPLRAQPSHCVVGRMRGRLAARIEAALGAHPAAGYVLGITVGATHRLSEADWELLRRTGTTHLLAISGLNIAMVAAPFLLIGPLAGRLWSRAAGRPHLGILPAAAAAAAYSALSGFAISTVRALVMLCLASAFALRRRRVQAPELLGAAGIGIVLLRPADVMSASFWLSFVAVAWLLVATVPWRAHGEPRGEQGGGVLRRAVGGVILLVRAQLVLCLGLAPLTVAWFQQVSLVAPLTNVVAVPVFGFLVMPLALLGAALVMVAAPAGALLLGLAADTVQGLLHLLRLAEEARHTVWEAPPAGAFALGMALAGAAILCWWRPLPLRPLALAWLLPLLAGTRSAESSLRVTIMDVGQGLAVLVQTRRHALLYDAGPAFRLRDAGESVVVPVLRAAGVEALDALVVSHDDQDHSGGARTVLEAFPDAVLVAPGQTRLTAQRFLPCRAGSVWEWDRVRFRMISPAGRWSSDNDGSCVLRVEAPSGASLLLPGDIERRREEELAAAGLLEPVDVVLAPHHGSRSSSSEALVGALRARLVVFSAGYRNRWGFPAQQTVARWRGAGACLFATAETGAIVLTATAKGWRVERLERLDGAHVWTAPGDAPACTTG